ncbi:MAG: HD domain-containing protein [Nitrospirae bacterium]|nr:HD domain-containing protein [Nitrospirota bacterium]MCL5976835.1 HD domain-containing protein [Nitrospirota bacterium]
MLTAIKLSDLIISFSKALDFVSPKVANHHLRVAIIASAVAREMGMSHRKVQDIFMAATIHDIGIFSAKEKADTFEFEIANPYVHAERGYLLLKSFASFGDVSKIVRYHHTPSENIGHLMSADDTFASANILHMSDRIEVLIDKDSEILSQREDIISKIKSRSGSVFMPEIVDAFMSASERESFWFDAASPEVDQIVFDRKALPETAVDIDGLLGIARLFSNIIDYRSPFTAVHSAGVSEVASLLAQMAGFSDTECKMMRIAGYLHDIGKLAIPQEILEKPGKLSELEYNIIKSHIYHSYRILEGIKGLETINKWASFHHEKCDGSGYPFHLKGNELLLGSRIMAVADVFTAITEDRPYRKGMSGQDALKIIIGLAKNGVLDHSIVDIAATYFNHINGVRMKVQEEAGEEYKSLLIANPEVPAE